MARHCVAANNITLYVLAQMTPVRARFAIALIREWNFARPMARNVRCAIAIPWESRDVGLESDAAARNSETRLSAGESMPFVLHYSVQSNTASGIRVNRRAPSTDTYTMARVQYIPLKAKVVEFRDSKSAELLIN